MLVESKDLSIKIYVVHFGKIIMIVHAMKAAPPSLNNSL